MKKHRLIIVMGVSGCGKSTIGKALADDLGVNFHDGDDFHPSENVAKMAGGSALNDQDRYPWLQAINRFAKEKTSSSTIVIACSALKEKYRKILSEGVETEFVYLKGSRDQILRRMQKREGHFMPPSLLDSQFAVLEEPQGAITVSISQSIEDIVKLLTSKLV